MLLFCCTGGVGVGLWLLLQNCFAILEFCPKIILFFLNINLFLKIMLKLALKIVVGLKLKTIVNNYGFNLKKFKSVVINYGFDKDKLAWAYFFFKNVLD